MNLVRRNYDKKLFAVKEIETSGMSDEEKKDSMTEVDMFKKLGKSSKHIVKLVLLHSIISQPVKTRAPVAQDSV